MCQQVPESQPDHAHLRADFAHYWARLMWYRDELWRITVPIWGVYGAFIASCVGYVWSSDKSGRMTVTLAAMMTVVIVSFTWVMLRVYKIYSARVYEAISALNVEVRKREQLIYDLLINQHLPAGRQLVSEYRRFRVYPRLHVIFAIIASAMAWVCIFTVWAAVDFAGKAPKVTSAVPATPLPAPVAASVADGGLALGNEFFWVLAICALSLVVFEFVLVLFRWRDQHLEGGCKNCDALASSAVAK